MQPTRLLGSCALIASAGLIAFDYLRRSEPETLLRLTTVGDLWPWANRASTDALGRVLETGANGLWGGPLDTLFGMPFALIGLFIGFGFKTVAFIQRRRARAARDTAHELRGAPLPTRVRPRSELADALYRVRGAFVSLGLFSGMINVLMLTGSFFMLQVYDRVLPSRSLATLVALALLAGILFGALAILEMIRGRMLVRIASSLDESLSNRVCDAVVRLPLRRESRGDGLQPLRDLDSIRSFLSGAGPTALFDIPWMPLYLAIIFAFHAILGIAAIIGAVILIALTLFTEALSREPMRKASEIGLLRNGLAEAGRRNAEVLTAMGMAGRITSQWAHANQQFLESNKAVSDVTGGFGSVSKTLRMVLQSAVLGLGAYLVIIQEATAGIIIAATILTARALAPVDLAIANWKGFLGARQSWKRLSQLLEALPAENEPMALPAPKASLALENVSVAPPGGRKLVIQGVSFRLTSGQGLGIIGPSASGKSSLVRAIVGAWRPVQGRVLLDNASLDQWSPESRGRHIGYLPQDVELFAGTVAHNIARFDPDADSEAIIRAARAAGVHDLIVDLPNGYETDIGEQGQVLSAGQRQRIALARALYEDPFLLVLDEPNSNLDADGEAALTQAIVGVRKRGGIVVVVAHRPSAIAGVDLILVMAHGKAINFGPKNAVLADVLAKKPAAANPTLTVVPGGER